MKINKSKIQEAYSKVQSTHESLGKAMSSLKTLQNTLKEYLYDRLLDLDIPKEYFEKIRPLIQMNSFYIDPEIRAIYKTREPKRIEKHLGSEINSGFYIYDPVILYKIEIKQSLDSILKDMDKLLKYFVDAIHPQYLKEGRTMKKFIGSIADEIVFTAENDISKMSNEHSETLCRLLKSYLDIDIIDNIEKAEQYKYNNTIFFNFSQTKNIEKPVVTAPAIIYDNNGIKEVIYKGTILTPYKK